MGLPLLPVLMVTARLLFVRWIFQVLLHPLSEREKVSLMRASLLFMFLKLFEIFGEETIFDNGSLDNGTVH